MFVLSLRLIPTDAPSRVSRSGTLAPPMARALRALLALVLLGVVLGAAQPRRVAPKPRSRRGSADSNPKPSTSSSPSSSSPSSSPPPAATPTPPAPPTTFSRSSDRRIAGRTPSVLLETWTELPHSYGIVGQHLALALASSAQHARLAVREFPPYKQSWQPVAGLLGSEQAASLRALAAAPIPCGGDDRSREAPALDAHCCPDALLRVGFPLDLHPLAECASTRVYVFGTTEYGNATQREFQRPPAVAWASIDPRVRIVTPSRWSARGFQHAGVHEDRLLVLPHGVDTSVFRCDLSEEKEGRRGRKRKRRMTDPFALPLAASLTISHSCPPGCCAGFRTRWSALATGRARTGRTASCSSTSAR